MVEKKHLGKSDAKSSIQQQPGTSTSTERRGSGLMRASLSPSEDSFHLISEGIMATPRGALQPTLSIISPDRFSVTSTHTMLLKRFPEENIDVPVDFEIAIEETGHGCFQYKLMCLSGFVYGCCSLSTTTLSFVLPAAQYDFDLDSADKGVLNTAPLWGMVVGAYIWGNFADNKGRRFVLISALSIDAIASFLSSFCQHYEMFYVLRIFNGFGIIGATSIIFAYMGEFLDHKHRDTYLARLELFWTLGIIALPCIGLAILPFNFTLGKRGVFIYNSWRLFVFACGIPSLIAVILLTRMPESPRFLLLQGKLEKSRAVLLRMFISNTGKPQEEFSVKMLSDSPEADLYYFQREKSDPLCKRFKHLLIGVLKQHKELLKGRSMFNIMVTSYIDFNLICVYYTMMLWMPELLNRMKHYVDENPGSSTTLCEMSAVEAREEELSSVIKMETFIHTIITCLACLPTTFMLLCLIEFISKKALLVGIMLCAAVPAILLGHVNTITEVVAMLSLLKSMTNLAEAVLFCAIVQIFPINTRGTALSLTVTCGRLGSVFGNIIFGYMIDDYCRYLFYAMGVSLVLSGLSSLLLPKMRRGH